MNQNHISLVKGFFIMDDLELRNRLKTEIEQCYADRNISLTQPIDQAIDEVIGLIQGEFYQTPCEDCWGCTDKINGEPNWKLFYCRYNR